MLSGLEGGSPLGAMAALGALQVCSQLSARLGEVRLSWRETPVWRPVLHVTADVTQEMLVEALLAYLPGRSQYPAFTWADDIKAPIEAFVAACETTTDRRVLDFMAAYGSDLVKAERRDQLKPTPFHMTGGPQRFFLMVQKLNAQLDPQVAVGPSARRSSLSQLELVKATIVEALFGPWRYSERQHAMGWDPAAERLYALRPQSPTTDDPYGVRGGIWLAVESLPFFPCAVSGGKLQAAGFGRQDYFSWPIWRDPLTVDAVRSLLLLEELGAEEVSLALKQRGVEQVYRAERGPVGDRGYYSVFRPASLVPHEGRREASDVRS